MQSVKNVLLLAVDLFVKGRLKDKSYKNIVFTYKHRTSKG